VIIVLALACEGLAVCVVHVVAPVVVVAVFAAAALLLYGSGEPLQQSQRYFGCLCAEIPTPPWVYFCPVKPQQCGNQVSRESDEPCVCVRQPAEQPQHSTLKSSHSRRLKNSIRPTPHYSMQASKVQDSEN
jgi:hypothetical protein